VPFDVLCCILQGRYVLSGVTISKNGENIGEHTMLNVRQILKKGELSMQDMYFDAQTQEWIALDLHPSLY
jgi:hypothetical protein